MSQKMFARVFLTSLGLLRYAAPRTPAWRLLSLRNNSTFKGSEGFSPDRIQQTTPSRIKPEVQLPVEAFESPPVNPESIVNYIKDPSRTVDELLSIDVRNLPSILRWHCLQAVLTTSSRLGSTTQIEDGLSAVQPVGKVDWPQSYLYNEHRARWRNWSLCIISLPTCKYASDPPDWFLSDEFKLLVLSTTSSASHLPLPVLLQLVGCFGTLWHHFDPKVSASLLRLLTAQVNELSDVDLIRLATLLRKFPSIKYRQTNNGSLPDSATGTLVQLAEEADLLRDATLMHIESKLPRFESLGSVILFQLLDAMDGLLTLGAQERILMSIEASLIASPQQQSLYTLVFTCASMAKLGIFRKGLVNRCLGQIQRKIRLSRRFPTVDQTWWIAAALTALANLNTIRPLGTSTTTLGDFVRPHFGQDKGESRKPSVDISAVLSSDWCRQLFTDITGYAANQLAMMTTNRELNTSVILPHAQIAYALALLGYQATSLLRVLQEYRMPNPQLVDLGTGSMPETSEIRRMLTLPDLLVGTLSNTEGAANSELLSWLPRIDWQFYYRLKEELDHRDQSKTDWQLMDYAFSKQSIVEALCQALSSRLTKRNTLRMLPFHRYQINGDAVSRFADILFVKESRVAQGVSKLVAGVVCSARDSLVTLPLQSFLSAHNSSELTTVQLLKIDCTDITWHLTKRRAEFCDQILQKVAGALVDSGGVATSKLRVWSDVKLGEEPQQGTET